MNYEINIVEQSCPHCGAARTIRVASAALSYCLICHRDWTTAEPDQDRALEPEPVLAYPFTEAEVVRLQNYRAAVRAGLYSEVPVSERRGQYTPDHASLTAGERHVITAARWPDPRPQTTARSA
jgi:hypothetical protein